MHFLAVADFVGNTGDIAVLHKEKYIEALKVAASTVRLSVSKTFL